MKVFAAICMLIDHIGMVFFPGQILWRVIGRLAMPIFAYCLGRGLIYTSSKKKYCMRLGVLALISQIPFWLLLQTTGDHELMHFNIGFTFLVAALCIEVLSRLYDQEKYAAPVRWVYMLAFIVALLVADCLNMDYGSYGILMVIFSYWVIKNDRPIWQLFMGGLLLTGAVYRSDPFILYLQVFGLLGFFVCWALSGISERRLGKLFYIFYPLHMIVLWGIFTWL